MTPLFKMIRLLTIIWLVSITFAGCTAPQQFSPPPKPTHFVTVIPAEGESLSDIARQYLGNSNLSFRISEFNNIDAAIPNRPLVVPLKPQFPYGIRRTGLQTVPILSYHAFSWRTSNYMTIREKEFEAQMEYLKTNGYQVIPLSRMLDLFKGKELPKKSVVITIDDGWGSVYRIAYPVLKKHGYPFTMFIQTDLINDTFKTLDWDKIREILRNGNLTVGCHTKAHRDLTQPKPGESFIEYFSSIKQELNLAKKIIFQETGTDPIHLAYPYGNTNQLVMDLLKEMGYSTGYTINRASNSLLADPLKLNRSMIYGTYDLEKFKRHLNAFEYFDLKSDRSSEEILSSHPSETTAQLLEDKGYWREALNHQYFIRDSLLQKAGDDYIQSYHQKPLALGDKSTVYYGIYKIKKELAEQKIEKLETRVRQAANDHYEKGTRYFSARETSRGIREMVKALYYNPELEKARNLLSRETNKPDYLIVSVLDGDSSKTIAKQNYNDTSKASLVSYYSEMQGGLIPGMKLQLPRLSQLVVKTNLSKPKPKKRVKSDCGVAINKPKNKLAKEFFAEGELFFNQNQIVNATKSIKTSVCLDPENSSAVELFKLLKGIDN